MSDVMLSFNKGLDSYLTKEEIKEQAPLVFADAPTNPEVSGKYLFVNTQSSPLKYWLRLLNNTLTEQSFSLATSKRVKPITMCTNSKWNI